MSMQDDDHQARGPNRFLKFDPQINSGHILQILVLVAGIFSAYSTLDKRVTVADQRLQTIEATAVDRNQRVKEDLGDLKTEVKDLRRAVEELSRTVRSSAGVGKG